MPAGADFGAPAKSNGTAVEQPPLPCQAGQWFAVEGRLTAFKPRSYCARLRTGGRSDQG